MSIAIYCPHCERAYQLADTLRGKTIRCKQCQGTFKVQDGQHERPPVRKSTPAAAAQPGYPAAAAPDPGYVAAASAAAVQHAPAPQFEEEIPLSRVGLLKSLMWVIVWQVVSLAFAIGMPILGYLAVTRQRVDLNSIIPLIVCVLATVIGIGCFFASLASMRLFLFSTLLSSSHYVLTADRLCRISRRGKVLDEIPFANVSEVRLVTRRLTEVMGDAADADVKARILHINLRNPDLETAAMDRHFMRWSQQVHKADIALSEDFVGVPIKTACKKIKKRWQQWQEGHGQAEASAPERASERGRVPWHKNPAVLVAGALGVAVALGGLVWVLIIVLNPGAPQVAKNPDPKPGPIVPGPDPKPKQSTTEGPTPNQPRPTTEKPDTKPQPPPPVPTAPEKLAPATLPGLIAYWPLAEGEGAITLDVTRKQPAVRHGSEWVQGIKGSALRFNGTSDYVDLGADAQLNFARGAPFTLAGWVATEADAGPICAFRKANGVGGLIGVKVEKGNLLGWVRDDDGSGFGGVQLKGSPIKDGKWHHFALTRHPDGTVELFLDAQSQGKDVGKNTGGPITTDLRALASDRFVVASGKKASGYFAGSIDEVCLYNRVLTPGEISVLAGK
jgi:hypothetical protein